MGTRVPSVAVCSLQTLFAKGGAELHVDSLARELRQRGYPVDVVRLPFTWSKRDLLQNALVWRLVNVEADVVISTNFPSYFVKHENKIIWLFHQHRKLYELYGTPFSEFGSEPNDAEAREIISAADTRFISEGRRIFTGSRTVADRLLRFNGIVGDPLYHPPPLYRSLFFREYGDFVLIPTRFEAHKRPELFVEAMRSSRSTIKGVVVGTGPQEQEVRRRIEKCGLEDRVRFLGFVDEATLVELYSRCAAVFYAPYDEDYGYVTLEAFYSKKPLVTANDSGGVLEFVADGETGLVSEADPRALGRNIDRLAESPTLCRRLGEAGYERVKDLSWDHVIERLINNGGS